MTKKIFTLLTALVLSIGIGWAVNAPAGHTELEDYWILISSESCVIQQVSANSNLYNITLKSEQASNCANSSYPEGAFFPNIEIDDITSLGGKTFTISGGYCWGKNSYADLCKYGNAEGIISFVHIDGERYLVNVNVSVHPGSGYDYYYEVITTGRGMEMPIYVKDATATPIQLNEPQDNYLDGSIAAFKYGNDHDVIEMKEYDYVADFYGSDYLLWYPKGNRKYFVMVTAYNTQLEQDNFLRLCFYVDNDHKQLYNGVLGPKEGVYTVSLGQDGGLWYIEEQRNYYWSAYGAELNKTVINYMYAEGGVTTLYDEDEMCGVSSYVGDLKDIDITPEEYTLPLYADKIVVEQGASGNVYIRLIKGTENTFTIGEVGEKCSITVESESIEKGTVTGAGTYNVGQSVTIEATATSQYIFDYWDDNNTENPRTINASKDKISYIAYFRLANFYAISTSGENGSVNIFGTTNNEGKFKESTNATLTATANKGYKFVKWQKDGVDIVGDATMSVTVDAAATYTAIFEEQGIIECYAKRTTNSNNAFYLTGYNDEYEIKFSPNNKAWPSSYSSRTYTNSEIAHSNCYIKHNGINISLTSTKTATLSKENDYVWKLDAHYYGTDGSDYHINMFYLTQDQSEELEWEFDLDEILESEKNTTYNSITFKMEYAGYYYGSYYVNGWIKFVVGEEAFNNNFIPSGTYDIAPLGSKTTNYVIAADGTMANSSVPTHSSFRYYDGDKYFYLLTTGTVKVINPNHANKPMYVKVDAHNSRNYLINAIVGSQPSLYNVSFTVEGSEYGDASFTCAEGHGYNSNGSVAEGSYYYAGTYLNMTATLKDAYKDTYEFKGWYNGSTLLSTSLSYQYTVGSSNNLKAVYGLKTRQVTIDTPTNGSIVVKDGSDNVINNGDMVEYGTVLTVTATPTTGYHFTGWTNDNITTTSAQGVTPVVGTITVTDDLSIGATFAKDVTMYTINITSPSKGVDIVVTKKSDGSVVNSGDKVEEGTVLTFTGTGMEQNKVTFYSWAHGLDALTGGTANPFDYTVTKNLNLEAQSKVHLTCVANPSAAGSVSSNIGTFPRDHWYGNTVNITATANTGYHFVNFTLAGDEGTILSETSQYSNSYTQHTDIVANFAPNTDTHYTVKHYKQNLDGSYPAEPTETEDLTGTTATQVTPAVKNYTGFTSPAAKQVTIKGDGTAVVEYKYEREKYTLTIAACEHGTIKVERTTDNGKAEMYNGAGGTTLSVAAGTELTLTATADEANHYEFKYWEFMGDVEIEAPRRAPMEGIGMGGFGDDEGSSMGDDITDFGSGNVEKNPYTFTMDGDIECRAVFEQQNVVTLSVTTADPNKGSVIVLDEDKENVIEPTKIEGNTKQYVLEQGTFVYVKAVANKGYYFTNWSNSSTLNPYDEFEGEGDLSLTAEFTTNFQLVGDKPANDVWYTDTYAPMKGKYISVTYVRTFLKDHWTSFSLPFNYSYMKDENQTFRGVVYELDNAVYDDGYLQLNFLRQTASIVANKPYVVHPAEEIENPIFENVKLVDIVDASYNVPCNSGHDVTYKNTLHKTTLDKSKNIIYLNQNKLYYPNLTKDTNMPAFRGFFNLNLSEEEIKHAPKIRIVVEGEEVMNLEDEAAEEFIKKYFDNEGNLIIENNGVKYDAQGKQL